MSCKKIILVGNASSLLQKKNGDKIDSYDYVVRMGNCTVKNYESYTGTKTDIYRVSWDRLLHNINKTNVFRPIVPSFNFHTLLFLDKEPDTFQEIASAYMMKTNDKLFKKSLFAEISFPEHIFLKRNERITHDKCLDFFVRRHNVQHVEYMDYGVRTNVFLSVNAPPKTNMVLPSSGILTLAHILDTRPNDDITITGYDGFATRYYWRDYETYFDGHSSYREKMYIKQLIKEGRISLLE